MAGAGRKDDVKFAPRALDVLFAEQHERNNKVGRVTKNPGSLSKKRVAGVRKQVREGILGVRFS